MPLRTATRLPAWRTPTLYSEQGRMLHLSQPEPTGRGYRPICGRGGIRGTSWSATHEEADCGGCLKVLNAHRPPFGDPTMERFAGVGARVVTTWTATDNTYDYQVKENRHPGGTVLSAALHVHDTGGRQVYALNALRTNGEAALAAAMWATHHRPRCRPRLDWGTGTGPEGTELTTRDPAGRTYTITAVSSRVSKVVARKGRTQLWTWNYDSDTAAMRACAAHAAGLEPQGAY